MIFHNYKYEILGDHFKKTKGPIWSMQANGGRILRRLHSRCSILIGVLLLVGCATSESLSVRHMETGVNSGFRYEGMSFAAYVKHSRNIILKYRTDITPENQDRILEANSPFELRPGPACPKSEDGKPERGILLIHGLSDSPFLMRDLAEHFHSRCFLVRAILLPGHGTVPGDLLKVTFQAWIEAARFGIRGLAGDVKQVYVGGFSTGGTLAVHEALSGERIDGLLLFAPAIALRSKLAFMANWHKPVSWANEGLKWAEIYDDRDYAKYESFAMNAADQIHLLTQELGFLQRGRPKLPMPVFMAASMDDASADTEAAYAFVLGLPNTRNRVVLYGRVKPAAASDRRVTYIWSVHKPMNIREFSHLSITLSPDNPHYGIHGDYANCLHYFSDQAKFLRCKDGGGLPYGELTKDKEGAGLFRRLTFNPFFDDLTARIDRFIESIE